MLTKKKIHKNLNIYKAQMRNGHSYIHLHILFSIKTNIYR